MSVKQFMQKNFKHFNAASCVGAADAWNDLLKKGGKMFLAMAGAMSTGELGITLAEMIRQNKVHAISTTGANLEEDLFNLVAHKRYKRIPHYRALSAKDEQALLDAKLNRVTDTCIPEDEAMRKLEKKLLVYWQKADKAGQSFFPYEYMYQVIDSGLLKDEYEIDPKNSWVIAACEKKIPIYTPGWEDSTMANHFVSEIFLKRVSRYNIVKTGLEQMGHLIEWYKHNMKEQGVGFFQIGGGIAGDFPICVVPLIMQDLQLPAKYWSYFCQISDSTTSYGSYSGAVPNEKITWGKLEVDTPKFIIESDASIVAPLIFQYVLDSHT